MLQKDYTSTKKILKAIIINFSRKLEKKFVFNYTSWSKRLRKLFMVVSKFHYKGEIFEERFKAWTRVWGFENKYLEISFKYKSLIIIYKIF